MYLPDALDQIDPSRWWNPIQGFLTVDTLEQLSDEFPLDPTLYYTHDSGGVFSPCRRRGTIATEALSPAWQVFTRMLMKTNGPYLDHVRGVLKQPFRVRFDWHLGYDGFEIRPHPDTPRKLATHLLYLNTEKNWQPEWGGNLCCFFGPKDHHPYKTYDGFERCVEMPMLGNHSFFLITGVDSWHGVKPISCPVDARRRLFNVIFESTELSCMEQFEKTDSELKRKPPDTLGGF